MLKVRAFLIPLFISVLALAGFAQSPQTQTAPIYPVNAKYANGVAPGYAPTAGSGLTLNLSAGTAYCSSYVVVTYAGGALTLAASATNYVYLDTTASCAPASDTTGFTSTSIPIATVVTGASSITTIADDRTMFSVPGSGGSSFTAGGDLSGSSSSQTVVGIQGHILPTLAAGYPHWTGTAWVYDTPSGGGSVDVNGSAVSSPNLNGTTPAAGSNSINVNFQVSGSNVSGQLTGDGSVNHFLNGHGGFTAPASQPVQLTRLGTLFAPLSSEQYTDQEPNHFYDSSPQIDTSYTKVWKLWYTSGYSTENIYYRESPDGSVGTWSNPIQVLSNCGRAFVFKIATSSYGMYCSPISGGNHTQINYYTSTNGTSWTLNTSNSFPCCTAWEKSSGDIAGSAGVVLNGSTWDAYVEWLSAADNLWRIGLWTNSSPSGTFTAVGTAPVIPTNGLSSTGMCGGPKPTLEGSAIDIIAHCAGPNGTGTGTNPTDEYGFSAPASAPQTVSLVSNSPFIGRTTADEGPQLSNAQISNASIAEADYDSGSVRTLIIYDATTNGNVTPTDPFNGFHLKGAMAATSVANLFASLPVDGAGDLSPRPVMSTNGVQNSNQIYYGMQQGTGIAISEANGIDTVTNTNPGALGASSLSASDSFARSAGSLGSNWTGPSTTQIISSGVVGEASSSGNQWSVYTGLGAWGADQCATVTLQANPTTGHWVGPEVRGNTAGTTLYWLLAIQSTNSFEIHKLVSGTQTTLSTGSPGTISVGDTFQLCVQGTTLTSYHNGTLVQTTTDSSISSGYPGVGFSDTTGRISAWSASTSAAYVTMGGSALTAGCTAGSTVGVGGATTGMVCVISGANGNPANVFPVCSVTAAGTVTPELCTAVSTTPASQLYNIRVLQ